LGTTQSCAPPIVRLPPDDCATLSERHAVGADPEDRHHRRLESLDPLGQGQPAGDQISDVELVGTRGRLSNQVGDADATRVQVHDVGRSEALRCVDDVVDDPGAVKRRVEAIAAAAEVALHRHREQARVDADDQQPDVGPEQIGECAAAKGLELATTEPHARQRYGLVRARSPARSARQ